MVYRELEIEPTISGESAKYEILPYGVTCSMPSQRLETDKPNPKVGAGICEFDPSGRYLATRNGDLFFAFHHL